MISDSHPHGALTVAAGDPEVEQRRHGQDGHADAAARNARAVLRRWASARSRSSHFPGAVTGRLRPYKSWRPIEQATMSYGYGLSASPVPAGARLHHLRQRRRADADVAAQAARRRRAGQGRSRAVAADRARRALDAADGGRRRAAPRRWRRPWATRWAARPAPRTSRKARAIQPASTARGSWAWRPIADPRIIVAVMVDEPNDGQYFGGLVAAPVFSEVVQQTLRSLESQARPRRAHADRDAPDPGRRGELLMPLQQLHGVSGAVDWLAQRGARALCADSRRRAAGRRLHRLARAGARRAACMYAMRSRPVRRRAWSRPMASKRMPSTSRCRSPPVPVSRRRAAPSRPSSWDARASSCAWSRSPAPMARPRAPGGSPRHWLHWASAAP